MFEDKQLIKRLKYGDREAMCRIYQKYGDSLLAMAGGIVCDRGLAEDVLHDVFLVLVRDIDSFVLTGRLKNYLARCVANRAIDLLRSRNNQTVTLNKVSPVEADTPIPDQIVLKQEEFQRLENALYQLPVEQRKVIMMHVHGQMSFRQIALCQVASINTIQGRYRYGMKKLKSLFQGQENEY
ncbi:MAG: RNA polymerase sigma factor [Anaerohalosphaera sp.]|nr:RNA polymerase sigma factor [Anaerohalosphaera sp.]